MSKVTMIRYIADRLIEAETQQEKQAVLERYSSDTLFKRLLYYTYHPMIVFGMDDYQPKLKERGVEDGMGVSKFMHIPEDLSENKLDYDEAVFACNLVLSHINRDEAELFLGMLKKDMGVGLRVETINNVWPDLIPGYPCQQIAEYSDDLAKLIQFPCVIQPIIKGRRINVIVKYNLVEFRDALGNILKEYTEYAHQFSNLAQNNSIVFDGAVIEDNGETKFILWDIIKYDGFLKGIDNRITYNWRFNGLDHICYLAREVNPVPCYSLVPSKVVGNWDEVNQSLKELSSDMVIKNLESIWTGDINTGNLLLRKNPVTI